MDWGLRLCCCSLACRTRACPALRRLVATLFNYGAFNGHDVAQTRLAVSAYSAGLLGLLALKILAPGFMPNMIFARQ